MIPTTIELSGPLAAKAFEREMMAKGMSYRTWTSRSRKQGLRYHGEILA